MKYDYVFFQSLYNKEERLELRTCIDAILPNDIADGPADGVVKTADVKCIMYKDVAPLLQKIRQRVLDVNKNYFGFDLFETSDYEILHYNKYTIDKQSEYGWHSDACKNECYDFKLTVLLNLSEQYSGGGFELFLNGPKEMREYSVPGSLLIFPSWIPHRVKPISDGVRVTLSQFYSGPNIR
jgi:predicted 2-oxoglutarate/Fe(II)-dependent dioxygenase YbiX